jgi:tetratricopeptide (TPR) repeat protein/predicted Ser/Thr protein kinase
VAMESERTSTASRIAREASALAPAAREAFVRERCGDDRALMDEVRRALDATEGATLVPDASARRGVDGGADSERASVLDSVLLHRTIEPSARGPEGGGRRRIPGFVIERAIGEGGMGTVYLAEQEKPRRVVALKVVKAGRMSGAMLRRFEHEAEILGRLQHPGIAQIYQAGTFEEAAGEGPVPFYAMEFVEGRALDVACKEMTQRQKLELFVLACDAVQHAHQKGVIHRDLKPSNIMVTAPPHGRPKVLDFGVARLANPEESEMTYHTSAGQLVGTLPYMSPEQVAGDPNDLDTRSDVYALGVILYELLSGRLPHEFSTPSLAEAVKTITESRIRPLSTLDGSIDADLVTIAGKALEKDRERRYDSAAELGADVERYLRHEPIQARRPTRAYLARKFVARNKALVAIGCAGAIALGAGVAGTVWQAVRATEGQRLAEERRTEAERARYEAQAALADSQAVTEFLTGMLASADPETARGEEITVRELLDQTAQTVPELSERPRVEMTVRTTLGNTYRTLGLIREALPHLEGAHALAEKIHGETSAQAMTLARSIALSTSDLNDPTGAEPKIREVVRALEAAGPERAPELALALGDLGRVLIECGKVEEAEATLKRSIALTRASFGPKYPELLTQMDHMGALLTDLGRFAEAEVVLREALAGRREVFGPDSPYVAYTLTTLASAVQKQGRHAETIELLTESLRIRRVCLAPEHPSLLINMANLATALIGSGRIEESLPLLRETIEKQRRVLGDESSKVLVSMGTLAYALEELDQFDEAESIYRHIVEIGRRLPPAREAETVSNFNNLAMLLWTRGNLEEAERVFDEAVRRAQAALPPDHYMTAIFRNNYGELLVERGKLAEARPHLVESHAVIEAFFGAEHARTAKSKGRLEKLERAEGAGSAGAG